MNLNDEEKMESLQPPQKFSAQLQNCCSDRVMEHLSKANLFLTCCIAAGLLLIAYLAAFSCEVSWLLEAHGDLPTAAYLLCAGYFIMFVASTILIHGLVTGLPWGLFSWSVIIGILSIPELAFVMIMTTQHWGLQSTHGLTELISYLIRLLINCLALICVIPTGLKWRREVQVLNQLQTLATRLQLQTPPPSVPITKSDPSRNSKKRKRNRRASAYDNPGFQVTENGIPGLMTYYGPIGSQNEFNASIFGLNPGQLIPPQPAARNAKRTQSLVDLRYLIPGMYTSSPISQDEVDSKVIINNKIDRSKNNNEKKKNVEDLSTIESISDPIYCTIEPKNTKLSRNCISLENLGGINKIQNDLSYGNNLLQNYHIWPWYGFPLTWQQHQQAQMHHFPFHYYNPMPMIGCGGIGYGGYTNPYVNGSSTNSKQSLGNESDDYRKYRDVAL